MNEFRQILKFRHLLKNLTVTEIKVRYKRSVLGYFWIMLNPLLMMLVMYVVFSNLFKMAIPHYFVYLISGLVVWNLFSQTTAVAKYSFITKAGLIKKAYLPKALLPLSNVFAESINFCFTLIPLFIILAFNGFWPGPRIAILPICALEVVVFAAGVSLFLSTIVVFFHDVNYIYEVLLLAWMYLTPIFWPINILPEWVMKVLQFNPMYHYLVVFRGLLYDMNVTGGQLMFHLGIGALFSIAAFLIGTWIYLINKDRLVFYL